MASGVYIDPLGQSVVVTVTSANSGRVMSLFSDRNASVPATNPITISTPTKVFVNESITGNVSLVVGGVERATTTGVAASVPFTDGGVGSLTIQAPTTGAAQKAGNETISGAWTFTTPPVGAGGLSKVYDPRSYGAVYDGTTDDSTAVQAAIDAAAASGGGTVWITSTSSVSTGLGHLVKINTTLQMREGVWLRGHGPATSLTGTANPMIAMPASGVRPDRITISDLFLQAPSGVGIKLDLTGLTGSYQLGWPRITVENITVADAQGNAFQIVGSGLIEARFINCVSLRAAGTGFQLGDTDSYFIGCVAAAGGGTGFNIQGGNNKFAACKSYGNAQSGFTVGGAGRHMLTSCEAQDNLTDGFDVIGNWNTLAGCLADSNKLNGFLIQGKHTLSGCSAMFGGGGSGQVTKAGFFVQPGSGGTTIDGISNCAVPIGGDTHGVTARVNGSGAGAVQTVAYAATITPDPYAGETVNVTLTGNVAIKTPTAYHIGAILTFILTQDSTGGRTVTFDPTYRPVWSPATTAGAVNTITFEFDGSTWQQVNATVGSTGASARVFDSFTRIDSAVTLGSTETGAYAWSVVAGTGGVSSNQAYSASGTGGHFVVDTGVSDYLVTAKIAGQLSGWHLTARVADAANFLALDPSNGRLYEYSTASGAQILVAGLNGSWALGDVAGLRVVGYTVFIYANGALLNSVGLSTAQRAATKAGIRCDSGGTLPRWDDFTITY